MEYESSGNEFPTNASLTSYLSEINNNIPMPNTKFALPDTKNAYNLKYEFPKYITKFPEEETEFLFKTVPIKNTFEGFFKKSFLAKYQEMLLDIATKDLPTTHNPKGNNPLLDTAKLPQVPDVASLTGSTDGLEVQYKTPKQVAAEVFGKIAHVRPVTPTDVANFELGSAVSQFVPDANVFDQVPEYATSMGRFAAGTAVAVFRELAFFEPRKSKANPVEWIFNEDTQAYQEYLKQKGLLPENSGQIETSVAQVLDYRTRLGYSMLSQYNPQIGATVLSATKEMLSVVDASSPQKQGLGFISDKGKLIGSIGTDLIWRPMMLYGDSGVVGDKPRYKRQPWHNISATLVRFGAATDLDRRIASVTMMEAAMHHTGNLFSHIANDPKTCTAIADLKSREGVSLINALDTMAEYASPDMATAYQEARSRLAIRIGSM